LLLGLAGALRRSELVALHANDIRRTGEGILVKIRASKTDQTGKGFTIPIARGDRDTLCAVKALEDWQAACAINKGARPLFVQVRKGDHITTEGLSDRAVALIIKARAEAVGLDPDLLAGHSLRAGGITQAKRNGHDEGEIAKLSGHKNIAILRSYLRPDDDFEGTAQVLRTDHREREPR
jgi:integrase